MLNSNDIEYKLQPLRSIWGRSGDASSVDLHYKDDAVTRTLPNPTEGRHLFIVRFWREDSEGASGGQWRGSVEHVPTGQRTHFVSLDVLDTFISKQLNNEAVDTTSQEGG
jgi:hypothetical protein